MTEARFTSAELAAGFAEAEAALRARFGRMELAPGRGTVTVAGDRYLLVRGRSISVAFFDEVRRLFAAEGGERAGEVARSLLFDVSHALGKTDARDVTAELGAEGVMARFSLGPNHFAMTGWGLVALDPESCVVAGDGFRLVFEHGHTFEAEAWIDAGRTAEQPVCVMSAGYSSGWCQEAFGQPLVTVEVSCRACGDPTCRFVMAAPDRIAAEVDAWLGAHPELVEAGRRYRVPAFFERVVLEERLRASEARYRTVFDAAADGLAILDDDGRILAANPAAGRLVGVAPEALEGAPLDAVVTPADALATLRPQLQHRREARVEGEVRCATGERVPVALLMTHFRGGTRGRFLVLVRDLSAEVRMREAGARWARELEGRVAERTADLRRVLETLERDMEARRAAEAARRDLEQRLERARRMESLGVLAGGVAHDLNNMLGPLVGYPDLVRSALPEGAPARAWLDEMQRSAEQAAVIVRDLLSLARRGRYDMRPLDLAEVVRRFATSPPARRLREGPPPVTLDLALPDAPALVRGSEPHLGKVLLNLAVNAADAMPEGGRLTLGVERRRLDEARRGFEEIPAGDYVVLTARDTGTGIAPGDVEHIFEPFFTRRAMGRSGTGLGLAVVYGVVRDHGGLLDVASEPGRGTCFAIWLSATDEEEARRAPGERDVAGTEAIVVIDDRVEQRALAARLLESLGYTVVTFGDPAQALAWLAAPSSPAELVLLDLARGAEAGPEATLAALRALRPGLPCLLVSSGDDDDAGPPEGARGTVLKPFTAARLGAAVRAALDGG